MTITTNLINGIREGTPVSVAGATGLTLTSNTVAGVCFDGAVLSNTSSVVIENNVFSTLTDSTCTSAALTALSADTTTAATARSDYNFFPPRNGNTDISWAGTSYTDEPTFNTATGQAAGHVTTYPERLPAVQQQGAYWAKGQAVTSLAVVPVNGRADLHNASSGTVSYSAQVVGYFTANGPGPGAAFVPSTRTRLLVVTLAGGHYVKVPVTGNHGVPPGAGAVMVNLTTLNAAAPGAITAWADGTARPAVTSLSYTNGQTNVTAAIVGVAADGGFALYNSGARPVTVVVDLLGSFDSY